MNRRTFLTTTATGFFANWFGADEKPPLDARFNYDVSAYAHTDPALLLYTETGKFPTGFHEPKCIAVIDDTILVGGDKAVKNFDMTGKLRVTLGVSAQPNAIARIDSNPVFIAYKDHFSTFSKEPTVSESLGERAHLTAIAIRGDNVFLADAGNREVLRCNLDGKVLSRIKGFAVPSPYFDLLAGGDGLLWVVNPGKHRVEAYNANGALELSWGETGMNMEGFCGCCNPVYLARLPDGRFVTSEKGLNRIKIYSATGKFVGVVAGPEQLVKDLELAKRACANCQIGFGFPVACDAAGRVLALDPATRDVRIFTPKPA